MHPTVQHASDVKSDGVSPEEYRDAAKLRAALRRFAHETERITPKHGLTPRRYVALLMIKASATERATVTELSEALMLAQNTVTELVIRMEDAGLVQRERSPNDGRNVCVRLTAEGEHRLAGAVAELAGERDRLKEIARRL